MKDNLVLVYDKDKKISYKGEDKKELYYNSVYIYDLDKKVIVSKAYTHYSIIFDQKEKKNIFILYNLSSNICHKFPNGSKEKKCSNSDKNLIRRNITSFINLINNSNYLPFYNISRYKGQTSTIVDDLKNNTCGLYNFKDKQYTKLINKNCNKLNYITQYDIKKNHYLITINLDNDKSYVYDLMDSKKIFELNDIKENILFYQYYDNNYENVAILDDKNNFIKSVLYKDKEFIKEFKDQVIYLEDKNTNSSLSNMKFSNKYHHFYNLKDKYYNLRKNKLYDVLNKETLYNKKGDFDIIKKDSAFEIININNVKDKKKIKGDYISNDSRGVYYKKKRTIYYYDIVDQKTYHYKLKKNEVYSNSFEKNLLVKDANFFINNFKDSYSKIINNKKDIIYNKEKHLIYDIEGYKNYIVVLIKNESTDKVYGIRLS